MTTCYAIGCGRVHGIRREHDLCAYHAADFRAGVAIPLRTGYTLWIAEDGTIGCAETARNGRAFAILAETTNEMAPAMLEHPEAVTNHR